MPTTNSVTRVPCPAIGPSAMSGVRNSAKTTSPAPEQEDDADDEGRGDERGARALTDLAGLASVDRGANDRLEGPPGRIRWPRRRW